MIKEILDRLCQNHTISQIEAKNVLLGIANNEYDPLQVASFLTVFRMRNVTPQELSGFRAAMLELAIKPDLGKNNYIDMCGTGGDGKDTFNISTLASFVAAGAGVKVVKHGNVGVSSGCGSSDVLQELGVVFTREEKILNKQLNEANICYLHAPLFHPAMKNIAPIRKALGVRTFFNLLGPLVNPANPSAQVIGVFALEIGRLFHFLLAETEVNYRILYAYDGYDEVSLTGDWRVFGNGIDSVVRPEEVGFNRILPSALRGGKDKKEGAKIFSLVLEGKGAEEQKNVVIINAAYGISAATGCDINSAIIKAEESLNSGRAESVFKSFVQISKEAV